jgi:chaperone required for assembly of F1-ATPase
MLPNAAFAEAIAEEWRGQGDAVDLKAMPLTALAFAAFDTVPAQREEIIEQMLDYGRSDLVCYRASNEPKLEQREAEAWDPILQWAKRVHGAALTVTSGISHVEQPPDAIAALRRTLEARSNFSLAALRVIVSITGSLIMALALADHYIGTTATFVWSRIDDAWQAERWGEDSEAKTRANRLFSEMQSAQIFLSLSA